LRKEEDALQLISQIGSLGIGYVVPFLFVLTLVVFFHELGHFLVARWCGVAVTTFSVGFGPEIVGFYDRQGTRWRISAIPLGGYVRFLGDENDASVPDAAALATMSEAERRRTFAGKNVAQRAAIVAAGPVANFILAIVILAGIFGAFGRTVLLPVVDTVKAGSVAEAAGFQAGDRILSIDGQPVESFQDLMWMVGTSAGQDLAFEVDRGGTLVEIHATPERPAEPQFDQFGNPVSHALVGICAQDCNLPDDVAPPPIPADRFVRQSFNPLEAVGMGVRETWMVVDRTFSYIAGVVAGRESPDQLGGPLRVAQFSGQVAALGFVPLLNLAAILSVSIGLINLLPVPMLDGGHLLFYAFEALRGRPLSERVQEIAFRVGLALVLMLFIFATWNDIGQLPIFRPA
jgi:regulator of sigma E protease